MKSEIGRLWLDSGRQGSCPRSCSGVSWREQSGSSIVFANHPKLHLPKPCLNERNIRCLPIGIGIQCVRSPPLAGDPHLDRLPMMGAPGLDFQTWDTADSRLAENCPQSLFPSPWSPRLPQRNLHRRGRPPLPGPRRPQIKDPQQMIPPPQRPRCRNVKRNPRPHPSEPILRRLQHGTERFGGRNSHCPMRHPQYAIPARLQQEDNSH